MEFQLFSLRSILNVTASLRQAITRTPWYAKRKSYRVLFWREITPLAVPIFLENTCVLLMGVLSTFLVSWLGKEAMAGVGLADSFNMVVMSFFAAIDLGTTVVVAFSLGKLDPKRAREAARQSLMIMTIFSIVLAAVIHYFGKEIIDFVAGRPRTRLKTWR
jgi:Na+-driven multidrug efflux pump